MPYDITYMQNLKHDTNEPIYKTEKDSQGGGIQERGGGGGWGWQPSAMVHGGHKQQGPAGKCRELYSVTDEKPSRKRIISKNICVCICITEPTCSTAEINTIS